MEHKTADHHFLPRSSDCEKSDNNTDGHSQSGTAASHVTPLSKPEVHGNLADALTSPRDHGPKSRTVLDLDVDPVRLRRLQWKIDLHILPFLMFGLLLNFMDKALYNYAQVMGFIADLHLKGNDISNAASAFYLAVLVAVIPTVYCLQRFPTAVWLAFSLFCWGICVACHAAIQDYTGLVVVRVLSGISEAAVPSCLMLLTGQFYTRKEQPVRFSIWYCGMGLGQIFGGLISWGSQHIPADSPLASWRIMFLAVGIFTSLIGVAVFFLVPSTPMQAWFLGEDEKILLLLHIRENQTPISETDTQFQPRQILEALTDLHVWLPWLVVVLHLSGAATISTFSSMLIRGFGFDAKTATLLNMPSGLVNMIATLFSGMGATLFGQRWAWATFASVVSILGASLLAFLPHSNQAGLVASIYLVNAISGATPLVMQWLVGNTAGHTKRAFTSASLSAAFALGSFIGPQTFRAADAPGYQPAKVASVVLWSVATVLIILLMICCRTVNAIRDRKAEGNDAERTPQAENDFVRLTDKQNPNFRYQY